MTLHYDVQEFHRRCLRMEELVRSRTLSRVDLYHLSDGLQGVLDLVVADLRATSPVARVQHHEGYADDRFCGPVCQGRRGACNACGDTGVTLDGTGRCVGHTAPAHSRCRS